MHRTAIRLVALLAPVALASWASADSTVTITKTHLCCNSCVKGVAKAVKTVDGATAKCDMEAKTITLTGPDDATVQKAVDALVAAGYYGKADGAKMVDDSGAKTGTAQTVEVSGIHNCCKKCTTAINDVIKKAGGTADVAAKATTFTVTGVDPVKLVEAFNEAGFSVKVEAK
jgi:mercuric ion binding protein